MSQLSDEEIYQEIGKIVANFELYKCDECATAVMRWLKENGIEGRIIKIQTAYGEDYSGSHFHQVQEKQLHTDKHR